MALTALQRSICRLLAASRREQESYVAGGTALNELLGAARRSRDVDLFHDTTAAVAATIQADRALLLQAGYDVEMLRDAPSFGEALVRLREETTLIQWVQDSAFRFFPLVEHADLGLTLHPFDLATNKVLAMAGRLEVRDWIDVIESDRRLQPLGYLVWSACGKDPGFNPLSLLHEMARSSRYPQAEIDLLDFDGGRPDAAELGGRWHSILREARAVCDLLDPEHVGMAVIRPGSDLCTLPAAELAVAISRGEVQYHRGTIGGAWPTFPARR